MGMTPTVPSSLRRLDYLLAEMRGTLLAWCLLDNHFRLLVSASLVDLEFVLGVFGGAEQFRSLHAAEHDGERCLDVAGLPRRGAGDEEARIMAESLLGGGASTVLVGILRQGRDCEGVETSLGRLRPSRFVPDSYRQTHREEVIHRLYAFELWGRRLSEIAGFYM